MSEERTLKKGSKNIPEGKRSSGKPRKKWLEDVEYDLKKMNFRGWRNTGRDRDAWKLILNEAKVLHRQQSRWTETEREREKAISQVIPLLFSLNKVHK
jgi:hypothetical protein